MASLSVFRVWLCLGLIAGAARAEQAWPRLDRKTTDFICLETLKHAREVFNSKAFHLYDPVPTAADSLARIAAQASGDDISSGDGLEADNQDFAILPPGLQGSDAYTRGAIHWGAFETAGWRLVIVSEDVGWRGSMYTLHRIDAKLTHQQFLVALGQKGNETMPSAGIGTSWRPPIIFRRKDNGAGWAVVVGEPFHFLSDWNAYGANGKNREPLCRVSFHAPVKDEVELLPPEVKTLARDLYRALGTDGASRGTLHPVAAARIFAMHMWANAAMRPWAALAAEPYNERSEVDRGLETWGAAGSNADLLRRIKKEYPAAERALAAYYVGRFSKSDVEAKEMAAKILDLAYRSPFVFPKGP